MSPPLPTTTAPPPPSDFTPPGIPVEERYHAALAFLYGRLNFERVPDRARTLDDFKLAGMQRLLTALGEPQRDLPTVHVAGSKGKGSTATMVARILQSGGERVGLFTSPHATKYEERFMINGESPSREEVVALVDRVQPVAESLDGTGDGGPTFFDLTTAIGWLHFQSRKVDVAVMEVGLGGRLDSTNICSPRVSVITSISRDHTRLLGETEEAIAGEKAGIIKPGVPVVSGVTAPGAAGVIEETACAQGAPLFRLGREFQGDAEPVDAGPFRQPPRYRLNFDSVCGRISGIELATPGLHQVRNAAVAVMACQLLMQQRSAAGAVFSGLDAVVREALRTLACPLRVEVLGRDPLTVVDAAHNPASVEALCQTLAEVAVQRRRVVFASSRDKETAALLAILGRHFDEIILTSYSNNARSLTGEELERIAAATLPGSWRLTSNLQEALRLAEQLSSPQDLVCVTGSFFLAAEAKQLLCGTCPEPGPPGPGRQDCN